MTEKAVWQVPRTEASRINGSARGDISVEGAVAASFNGSPVPVTCYGASEETRLTIGGVMVGAPVSIDEEGVASWAVPDEMFRSLMESVQQDTVAFEVTNIEMREDRHNLWVRELENFPPPCPPNC